MELVKTSEADLKLIYQLFIGKVCDEIGFDKTMKLLTDSKKVILKGKL